MVKVGPFALELRALLERSGWEISESSGQVVTNGPVYGIAIKVPGGRAGTDLDDPALLAFANCMVDSGFLPVEAVTPDNAAETEPEILVGTALQ